MDELARAFSDMADPQPASVSLPLSHPTGGAYTYPSGNAAFKLTGAKSQSLDDALMDALKSVGAKPASSVSLPSSGGGPSVTYPAQRSQREAYTSARRAVEAAPQPAINDRPNIEAVALAQKRVLSPEDAARFQSLIEGLTGKRPTIAELSAWTPARTQGLFYAGGTGKGPK